MSLLKVFGFLDDYFKPKKDAANLVSLNEPHSYIGEQYSSIAAKIMNSKKESNLKSIVVTSSLPDEGKTTTVCNLAVCLTNTFNQNVLIVDGDLRKPSIKKFFDLENDDFMKSKKGLTSLLRMKESELNFNIIKESILKTNIPNVSLLLSGKQTEKPGLLLNSPSLKAIDDSIKENFDIVIYDTPPIMFTSDSQAIGKLADIVLFVVKAETTPRKTLKDALTRLSDTGAEPDACILTSASQPLDLMGYINKYKYKEYYKEYK